MEWLDCLQLSSASRSAQLAAWRTGHPAGQAGITRLLPQLAVLSTRATLTLA